MLPIFSLFIVIVISILITRVASLALVYTGLSREAARFQARSAFTGAGFTTNESERVVNHPVRRRIVLLLMLLGNAGIVTAVSSLILTFVGKEGEMPLMVKMGFLIAGVMGLWALAMSSWVDHWLSRMIDWALNRYTSLETKDYASLMHLAGEYRLVELLVKAEDWVAGKTLAEADLWKEGVVVLGIVRSDGRYVGVPRRNTRMNANDTLILYGRDSDIQKLDERKQTRAGDKEHEQAMAQQQKIVKGEMAKENPTN